MELFAASSPAAPHLLLADWHANRRAVYAASFAAGGYFVDEAGVNAFGRGLV